MQKSNLVELFENLLNATTSEEQTSLLERIHIELTNITAITEFQNIQQDIPWTYLFGLLRSNNNDEIERLICSILEYCITNLSIEQLRDNFYGLLNDGLDQQTDLSVRGKLLCLKGFERLVRCSNEQCFTLIQNLFQHNQINALLHLFLDSDQQVLWLKSKEILEQMIRNLDKVNDQLVLDTYLNDHYFHASNRELLLSSNERNEIVRLRLYEYLIDLCLIDHRVYQHITEKQKLLDPFLHDCTHHGEDILYLMNCLELLTSLTQKPHTLAYLQNKTTVTDHYFRLLISKDEYGVVDLIKPSLIKFFGSYLRNYLLLLEHEATNELLERFLPFLFNIFLQTELGVYTAIGLDTVGFLGKTLNGKNKLLSSAKFADFMEILIQTIRSSATELRSRALTCLADLFYLSATDKTIPAACSLTEQIYNLCNRVFSILPIIISIAKQPFVDLRLAAYRCLVEMTKAPWGLHALNNEPGLFEFLLNRSTEKDKDGKEAKYAIIQSICQHGDEAKSIIGNVNFLKFRRYMNEGVFYVEPEANIAFDGST